MGRVNQSVGGVYHGMGGVNQSVGGVCHGMDRVIYILGIIDCSGVITSKFLERLDFIHIRMS